MGTQDKHQKERKKSQKVFFKVPTPIPLEWAIMYSILSFIKLEFAIII